MKIDLKGMEYRVLSGFCDFLNKVSVIQFQYGIFNISSKDLLIDFYNLLTKYGFVIGKIMPNCEMCESYHYSMEGFYGDNYLAVKSSNLSLIAKLQNFPI